MTKFCLLATLICLTCFGITYVVDLSGFMTPSINNINQCENKFLKVCNENCLLQINQYLNSENKFLDLIFSFDIENVSLSSNRAHR